MRFAALFWALAAAAVIPLAVGRYPIDEWAWPVLFAALGLACVLAPMPARHRLAAALLLGLFVRIIAVPSGPLVRDPFFYDQLASNVLAGRGLTVDVPIYGGDLRAVYAPVYPLLLAAWRWIGVPALGLNTLIDLWASACVYLLSGRSDRSAAAYFLFPSILLNSLLPLKDGLALALLLTNLLVVRRPVAYGAISGLLALTQPAWAPIPIIYFLLCRQGLKAIVWAAIGGLAVMLPWWLRNWLIFGTFVPLTTTMGLSLLYAANGGHTPTAWMPLDEPGRSAEAARIAMNVIAADPLHYAWLTAKQIARAFLWDNSATDQLAFMNARWVGAANLIGQLAWIGLIALAGWRQRWSPAIGYLLVASIVSMLLFGIWFEFSPRHRAFIVPILICVAFGAARSLSAHDRRSHEDHRSTPSPAPPAGAA